MLLRDVHLLCRSPDSLVPNGFVEASVFVAVRLDAKHESGVPVELLAGQVATLS